MKRRIPEFIFIFVSESPNRKVNSCTPCETSFESMSVYDLLHLATSPALDRVDKDQWKESSLQGRIHLESTQSCCRQTLTEHFYLTFQLSSQPRIRCWDCLATEKYFLLVYMPFFTIVRYQKRRWCLFAFDDIANYCYLLWTFNVFMRMFSACLEFYLQQKVM
jgi:hypothetical protein